MNKKTKYALIFIAVVVIACILGFINSCILTGGISTDALVEKAQEKVLVRNVLLTETKDGAKYWEIFADGGEYKNSRDKIFLNDIIGNFYKKNEVVLSFEGEEGFYESKIKRVTLLKNAKIAAKNDTYISADKIVWEGAIDKIIAEGNVKVLRANEILTISDKTIFTTDFKEFKIFGNTTTKLFNKE